VELIEALRQEGHPIVPGSVGENVTVAGLDWKLVRPGAVLRVGGVMLEVTTFTAPCRNIRKSFLDEDFARISEKLHPGWSRVYARVVGEGILRVGDDVEVMAAVGY
jgi:MOSC domain-containing protein YiiM